MLINSVSLYLYIQKRKDFKVSLGDRIVQRVPFYFSLTNFFVNVTFGYDGFAYAVYIKLIVEC